MKGIEKNINSQIKASKPVENGQQAEVYNNLKPSKKLAEANRIISKLSPEALEMLRNA